MKSLKHIMVLISLALAAGSVGCATTAIDLSGGLPPAGRGTLKGNETVRLSKVDDQTGSNNGLFASPWDGSFTIFLSPGAHTLSLDYYSEPLGIMVLDSFVNAAAQQGSDQPVDTPRHHYESKETVGLDFVAEAGHIYTLDDKRENLKWTIFIRDSVDGKEVGTLPGVATGDLNLVEDNSGQ